MSTVLCSVNQMPLSNARNCSPYTSKPMFYRNCIGFPFLTVFIFSKKIRRLNLYLLFLTSCLICLRRTRSRFNRSSPGNNILIISIISFCKGRWKINCTSVLHFIRLYGFYKTKQRSTKNTGIPPIDHLKSCLSLFLASTGFRS